jgi:protein-S-isoprenylcysteine O-methyltransferase Ste14
MTKLKRNKLHSWSFVLVQAVILLLIIFMNNEFGANISEFRAAGLVLEIIGWAGIIISAFNIRTVLTAEPLPKEGGNLSTNGLYKHVRHPMYTSVLSLSLGIALTSGNIIKYVLVILLTILFYFKSVYEERYLLDQYPEYKPYSRKTPRFIPFINRLK